MKGTEEQVKKALEQLDEIKADTKVRILSAASSAAKMKVKGDDQRSAEYLEEVYELNRLLDALALIRASDADAGSVFNSILSIFDLDDALRRYDKDVWKLIEKMKDSKYRSYR